MCFTNKQVSAESCNTQVCGCGIFDQGWMLRRSQTSNNTVSSGKHINVKQTGVFGSKESRYQVLIHCLFWPCRGFRSSFSSFSWQSMQDNEITLKELLLGLWRSLLKAVKDAEGLGAQGQVT